MGFVDKRQRKLTALLNDTPDAAQQIMACLNCIMRPDILRVGQDELPGLPHEAMMLQEIVVRNFISNHMVDAEKRKDSLLTFKQFVDLINSRPEPGETE